MADLSKLTDDELVALQEGRLDALSDEALASLQEQPAAEAPQEETISAPESALAGTLAGVPSAVMAGLKTAPEAHLRALDVLKGNVGVEQAIEDVSESFNKEKSQINAELDKARAANPAAYEAADLGSALIGSLAIPGGALAKTGAQVGIGAATGLARSDRPLSKEGAVDALVGGGFGLAGAGLIKGISKAGKSLKQLAGFTAGEAISGAGVRGTRTINRHLRNTSQSVDQFADDMLGFTGNDGKKIFTVGKDRTAMLEDFVPLTEDLGRKYAAALTEADSLAKPIPSREIYNKVKTELVDDILSSPEPDTRQLGESLLAYLDDTFKASPDKDGIREFLPDWSVSKLQKLAKDMSKKIERVFDKDVKKGIDLTQSKARVSGLIREEVEDSIAAVSEGLSDSFKTIKRQYGNAVTARDILIDSVSRESGGAMGALKDALSTKGLLIGGAANIGGGSAGKALGISAIVNTVLASGRVPAGTAQQLNRVANFLSRNPEHPVLNRLITAAHSTNEIFRGAVSSAIAEVELTETPLSRTLEDAKERQASIIAIARQVSPKLGDRAQKVFDTGTDDEIAAMMDMLSKEPAAKGLIHEGKGWAGKVYNKEDMDAAESALDSAREISYAQKLQHKLELKKSGKIPQPQPEQDRFLIWRSDKNEEPEI